MIFVDFFALFGDYLSLFVVYIGFFVELVTNGILSFIDILIFLFIVLPGFLFNVLVILPPFFSGMIIVGISALGVALALKVVGLIL